MGKWILMLWMDGLLLYGPVIYAYLIFQYAGFMYGICIGKIATEESDGDPAVYNEYIQEGSELMIEICNDAVATTDGFILKKTRTRLRIARALMNVVKKVL